jgi:hypothetical protein
MVFEKLLKFLYYILLRNMNIWIYVSSEDTNVCKYWTWIYIYIGIMQKLVEAEKNG